MPYDLRQERLNSDPQYVAMVNARRKKIGRQPPAYQPPIDPETLAYIQGEIRDRIANSPEAPPGEKELGSNLRIANRKALMNRNVANYQRIAPSPVSLPTGRNGDTVPAGSVTPEGTAARNLRNELALQPGGADRLRRMQILNARAQAPAAEAAPPPTALARGHTGVMSEVGRGLDPEMAQRIQAGFAARAARMAGGGDAYDRRARASADAIAAGLKQRPTREGINRARYEQRMADMARLNMMQVAPYVALAQAQHGGNPAQMAQANYHNAMADAIRQQMAGEANGAAKAPEQLPPGHVQIAPGVVKRPPTWWEKLYGNAVANGSWFPPNMYPPVMIGQPGF